MKHKHDYWHGWCIKCGAKEPGKHGQLARKEAAPR